MTRPKPKTVRAWCFAQSSCGCPPVVADAFAWKENAVDERRLRKSHGMRVGPVVRIEVPAPKERKR